EPPKSVKIATSADAHGPSLQTGPGELVPTAGGDVAIVPGSGATDFWAVGSETRPPQPRSPAPGMTPKTRRTRASDRPTMRSSLARRRSTARHRLHSPT